MIRNIVDLDNVLTILTFTALNNCLGNMGKVVFFKGSKCHLSIDWEKFSRSLFFMYNKINLLPLKAKKIGLSSRGIFVFSYLFAQ